MDLPVELIQLFNDQLVFVNNQVKDQETTQYEQLKLISTLLNQFILNDREDESERIFILEQLTRTTTTRSTTRVQPSPTHDINEILERLYSNYLKELESIINPPKEQDLLSFLTSQQSLELSLQSNLITSRTQLLSLYSHSTSTPSVPLFPSPPSLESYSSTLQLSSSSLSAASAKQSLLLYTAEYALLLSSNGVEVIHKLRKLYQTERKKLEFQVTELESEWNRYQLQLKQENEESDEYNQVLSEYQSLLKQEKLLRHDIKRLGGSK